MWPLGFYLRAVLKFCDEDDLEKRIFEVNATLSNVFDVLKNTKWNSLPELTNQNAEICKSSCSSQAWSIATILETLYDLSQLQQKKDAKAVAEVPRENK